MVREVFRKLSELTTGFPQGVGNGEKIGHQGEVGDRAGVTDLRIFQEQLHHQVPGHQVARDGSEPHHESRHSEDP